LIFFPLSPSSSPISPVSFSCCICPEGATSSGRSPGRRVVTNESNSTQNGKKKQNKFLDTDLHWKKALCRIMLFHRFKSAVICVKVFDVSFIWFRLVRVGISAEIGTQNAEFGTSFRIPQSTFPDYSFGFVHTRNGQSLHMLKPG
jgi:hypothetical protein